MNVNEREGERIGQLTHPKQKFNNTFHVSLLQKKKRECKQLHCVTKLTGWQ